MNKQAENVVNSLNTYNGTRESQDEILAKNYQSPVTAKTSVEVEGNFCASVYVEETNTESLSIEGQKVTEGNTFDFSGNDTWK